MAEKPSGFKMANNKITLKLDGIVPLDLYGKAVTDFAALVADLTEEIVGVNGVQWTVTELDSGSAFVEVTGYAVEEAERVATGYGVVGNALQTGQMIPYSEKVVRDAIELTSILNGKITRISLGDANEVKGVVQKKIELKQQHKLDIRDFGVVEGIVHTVSDAKGVVIGLYDDIFDKRIECFLSVSRVEEARDIWRKRVRIFGMIKRDPDTGRAIDVRNVTSIEPADDKTEGGFLRARGVLHWEEGDEPPEVAIRRTRDGN